MRRHREPGGLDHRVILWVSWSKTLILAIGPFIAIFAGALLFSNRSIERIMTWENWITPTITTPVPVLSIICALSYVAMIAWKIFSLAGAPGGKYLWADDSSLILVTKRIMNLDEVDLSSSNIQGGALGTLVIRSTSGGMAIVRLAFTSVDREKLLSDLRAVATATRRADLGELLPRPPA